jgi:octaprenyl-diphosphate synthase
MGKNLGDDLREGKTTLPLIAAMQRGTASQKVIIKTAIETGGVAMLNEVVDIVKATGALDVARLSASAEAQRAVAAATLLPQGPHTDCLLQLAAQLLDRRS